MTTLWSWLRMWHVGFPAAAIEEANLACDLIEIADQLPPGILLCWPRTLMSYRPEGDYSFVEI